MKDFWLKSIQARAPTAPVFLVGTHVDLVESHKVAAVMQEGNYMQIKGAVTGQENYVSHLLTTGSKCISRTFRNSKKAKTTRKTSSHEQKKN